MATPPSEEVEIRRLPGGVLAQLHGEVDLSNAAAVRERLLDAVPNHAERLVLDLSSTQYLDSSGVRLIFELAERLENRGQRFSLVVPDGSLIKRVLVLAKVEQAAPVYASVDAALGE